MFAIQYDLCTLGQPLQDMGEPCLVNKCHLPIQRNFVSGTLPSNLNGAVVVGLEHKEHTCQQANDHPGNETAEQNRDNGDYKRKILRFIQPKHSLEYTWMGQLEADENQDGG